MIVLAIISIASMLLAPKPRIENARQGLINDVSYPRATVAAPVPLILGTVQLKSANTTWMGDLTAVPQRVNTSTGGWSGMGNSLLTTILRPWGNNNAEQQTVGFKYYLGIDLALCLGEGVKLYTIWAGNAVLWSWLQPDAIWPVLLNPPHTPVPINPYSGGAPAITYAYDPITGLPSPSAAPKGGPGVPQTIWTITQNSLFGGDQGAGTAAWNGMNGQFAFYNGDFVQPTDNYLQVRADPDVSSYGGFCHIVFHGCYVGNTTAIPPYFFELQRFTNSLGIPSGQAIMPNGFDINPIEAIYYLLTSPWGGAGLSSTNINVPNFMGVAAQVFAENSGISLNLGTSNQVKDIIQEILRAIAGIMYQDPVTGLVNIRLLRNDYDISTLPVFDESSVIEVSTFAQQTWSQTFNQMHVKFIDRSNLYTDGLAEHSDFSNITQQGRIVNIDISMPVVYDGQFAVRIAARELSQLSVPLYQANLVLNRKAIVLRPGDVILFNWPERNISNLVLRIQKVKLGTLTDGKIAVVAIQDIFANSLPIYSVPEPSQRVVTIRAPANILNRESLEAPWWITQNWTGVPLLADQGTFLAFASAPSINSLSWSGYVSFDDFLNSAVEMDQVPYSSNGKLVNNYNPSNPGTNDDVVTGITINNVSNVAVLQNVSDGQLRAGNNLVLLGNELMNYTSFVDHGDGTFTLQGVRRSLLDTAPTPHLSGDFIWFLQDKSSLPVNRFLNNGTEIFFKQIDNTAFGSYPFDSQITDTLIFSQRANRPLRPAQIQANGSAAPGLITDDHVVLTWRERLRTSPLLYWEDDATQTPEAGQTYIVRVTENGTHVLEFPVSGTTYTYHFRSAGTVVSFDIFSVLDGLRSLSTASMSFSFIDSSYVAGSIETRGLDTIDDRTSDDIVFR